MTKILLVLCAVAVLAVGCGGAEVETVGGCDVVYFGSSFSPIGVKKTELSIICQDGEYHAMHWASPDWNDPSGSINCFGEDNSDVFNLDESDALNSSDVPSTPSGFASMVQSIPGCKWWAPLL
jgi:hypothetical protein